MNAHSGGSAACLLLILVLFPAAALPRIPSGTVSSLHAEAEALWAAGSREAALQAFDRVLSLDPSHIWARAGRGFLRRDRGQFAAAATDLLDAARQQEAMDRTAAIELLAAGLSCRLQATDWQQTLPELRRAGERLDWPETLVQLLIRGAAEYGDTGTVSDILRQAARSSKRPFAWQALLDLLDSAGEDVRTLLVEARQDFPSDPELLGRQIRCLRRFGQQAEADILLAQAPRSFHDSLSGRRLQAEQLQNQGQGSEAVLLWQDIWRKSGQQEDRRQFLDAVIASGTDTPEFVAAWREETSAADGRVEVLSNRFERCLQAGHYRLAQRMINVVADLYPWAGGWQQLQARLKLSQGDRAGAIAIFEQALQSEHALSSLYLGVSELYFADGRTDEDRLILTRAAGLFREQAETRREIFLRTLEHGHLTLARSLWPSVRRIFAGPRTTGKETDTPANPEFYRLRKSLFELDPARFLDFFRALPAEEQDDELRILAAEILETIGKDEEALSLLAGIPSTSRAHKQALLALGRLHLERAEFDSAEILLQEALRLGDAQAYGLLGRLRYALGDDSQAVELFRAALERIPALPGIHGLLALAQWRLQDRPGLASTLKQALQRGEEIPGLLLDQLSAGDLTALHSGRTDNTADVLIRFRLARLAQRRGDYEEALDRYAQLSRQLPGQPRIEFHRGECLLLLGRTEEARLCFAALLQSGVQLAAAEARDRVLNDPYPCLSTLLAGAAIALGRDREAIHYLRAQAQGFLRGTTDLAEDHDLMRGDVTALPYFHYRFLLQGLPAGTREWLERNSPAAAALRQLQRAPADSTLRRRLIEELADDDSTESRWIFLYLLQEDGQVRECFRRFDALLAAEPDLTVPARLVAALQCLQEERDPAGESADPIGR